MDAPNEADITLAGLSICVDQYQYPDSTEYWDANWLSVRIHCIGQNATVNLSRSCVHVPELASWLESCVSLNEGHANEATLPTMEPYLQVTISHSRKFKGLVAIVKLSPDNVSQFHEFRFPIDQSHIPRLILDLRKTLSRFPIRALNMR